MGKFQDLLCSEPAFRIFVNSSEYKFHLAPPDAASPTAPTLPLAAQICPPPRLSCLFAYKKTKKKRINTAKKYKNTETCTFISVEVWTSSLTTNCLNFFFFFLSVDLTFSRIVGVVHWRCF